MSGPAATRVAHASPMQLVRGLRDLAALVAGALELVRRGQARAVAAGDRGGTVGRAAGDLVQRHLAGVAVIETDDDHAEVQQVGNDREQRHLLPAMLRGGRRERAADLAVQCSARPKPTGLVEEVGQLGWHPAKPGAGSDDDRIVGSEVIDFRDRRGLIELVVRLPRDLVGHQFRHALDVNLRTGLPRTLGDRIRHRFNMAIGRVVEHQNLRHDVLLERIVGAAAAASPRFASLPSIWTQPGIRNRNY